MTANLLSSHLDALSGCRFCPMCKPANEVAHLSLLESHSTRARAMMLWRVASGHAQWQRRQAELLYQSTLDSISQAWCICHYPVSDYVAAARAEVFEANLAPEVVRKSLERSVSENGNIKGEALLLAGEAAEWGVGDALTSALQALDQAGVSAQPARVPSGALAYCLGARQLAEQQARQVVKLILSAGATLIVADGPQTLWALRRLYPSLQVDIPQSVRITSLSELLAQTARQSNLKLPCLNGQKVVLHDSRCACLLADAMAQAIVLQPGYAGPEEALGEGEVFDAPRYLVDAMEMQRVYSVWSRSLTRSCGADDGLWLTYPKLAAGLARQRLQEAKHLGAEMIISDSLLCAQHLRTCRSNEDVVVHWLPELLVPDHGCSGAKFEDIAASRTHSFQ
ncbi:MAG: hypothetical protein L0387_07555 [Acidobacteria bacterium]|nr:hypothetical protein [Acidobacteriota bacterium]MCI0723904.1 hypothetical protein [Acidobacteriota bacterium]